MTEDTRLREALEPLLAAIEREFGEPYPIPEADMGVEEFLAGQAGKVRAALQDAPATGEGLAEAWAATEAAIPDGTRLVLWQDKGGPRYLQVLAPEKADCECGEGDCDHLPDVMAPVATRLADYPSKGLGDLLEAFRSIATDPRLAATTLDPGEAEPEDGYIEQYGGQRLVEDGE